MQTVDSREFTEWQAAYRVQPWGDDWAQTDLIAWLLHSAHRAPGAAALDVGHFLPAVFPAGLRVKPHVFPATEDVVKKLEAWGQASGLLRFANG